MLECLPAATSLYDEWDARHKFPVLADFESPFAGSRWSGSADFRIVPYANDKSGHHLKVQTDTSTYSGITTKYFPRHWRGYQKFSFQILNPGPDIFFITCRINDRQHNRRIQEYNDRFNQRFMLDVGLNDITIDLDKVFQAPQTRDMDQNDICEIMFFVTRQKTRRTFFLDNLMLEK